MLIPPGEISTWLYTSQFVIEQTPQNIAEFAEKFGAKNSRLGLTGFLVTDGNAVMQLLEGEPKNVENVKSEIKSDPRHTEIVSEVEALEARRAYPNWSMRIAAPSDYGQLFTEIESARIGTIATNIAALVFDITFDHPPDGPIKD